jgi:hypothetical protein
MFVKELCMAIMVTESSVDFWGGTEGTAAATSAVPFESLTEELATNVRGGPEGMSRFFKESFKV